MERVATGQKKPRLIGVPKVSELVKGEAEPVVPPDDVMRMLGQHTLIAGVDIETADWEPGSTSLHRGQFGFLNLCRPEVFEQRIVQIGWAVGDLNPSSPLREYKEIIIRPTGFKIAEKAAAWHGVTHERALIEGIPLRDALSEFMIAMERVTDLGGRVIIHHLEFDAGIIARELHNAGMDTFLPRWCEIAQQGFCTMDPAVCRWAQMCRGRVFQAHECDNIMKLGKLLDLLLPSNKIVLDLKSHNRLHTGGGDAQAHRLVYIALRSLVSGAN